MHILEKYFIKVILIEDFFHVHIAPSKYLERLGEFLKVMQTLKCVSGLHNCLEFSEHQLCPDDAM